MAVTQYIGARYVPLFANPLDWDVTKEYEPLTIVYYAGNSYTSRQSVPAGITLDNADYWAITGNYNAQIEAYRKEVKEYDGRITANAEAIEAEVSRAVAEEAAIKELITAETTRAKAAESELATGVSNAITHVNAEKERAEAAETELKTAIDGYKKYVHDYDNDVFVCIGDSILAGWSTENPSGITAWDVYAGESLGFKPSNVIKSAVGGAGWSTGTLASTLVNNSISYVTAAGHTTDNVTAVAIGLGVNDSRASKTYDQVAEGVTSAITAAVSAYKKAEIHVFPCVMGNFGYSPQTQIVIDACLQKCSNIKNVVVHDGVWTWNYDYPRDGGGVSSDRIHLLEAGLTRTGYNVAKEMSGESCFVHNAKVKVSDISGSEAFTILRSGGSMSLSAADSYGTNANGYLWGIDNRYLNLQAAGNFTDASGVNTLVLADGKLELFKVFNATFSSRGLYGSMAWPIKSEWNWIE